MELFDFIDGIEEDKYLRVFFSFLVDLGKYCTYYVFVHFGLVLHHFVIVFDTFKGHSLTDLFLNHFVYVEFYHVFNVLFVKLKEFFLHCG